MGCARRGGSNGRLGRPSREYCLGFHRGCRRRQLGNMGERTHRLDHNRPRHSFRHQDHRYLRFRRCRHPSQCRFLGRPRRYLNRLSSGHRHGRVRR